MDYIVIALWGLLTGGLLFSGSSDMTSKEAPSQPTQPVAQLVEEPTMMHKNELPKVESSEPVVKIVHSKSTALTFNNGGYSDPDKAVKDNVTKALTFGKTKEGKAELPDVVEPTHRVRRDTVVVYAIKTQEGQYYTLDREEAFPPAQVQGEEAEESFAITEPLIETPTEPAEPVVAKPQPKSNVRLPKGLKIEQLLCDEHGNPVIHKLKGGESLTQIAQHYYEDASFWPYIFEVNRHKLSSPDRLQEGMKLYLPDPEYYDIDGDNPRSVSKAKAKIAKYIK